MFLRDQSEALAIAIGGDAPFATALILYFFVDGIIQGYLLTRMFLARQFSRDRHGQATRGGERKADA